jgi:hypothetical protein
VWVVMTVGDFSEETEKLVEEKLGGEGKSVFVRRAGSRCIDVLPCRTTTVPQSKWISLSYCPCEAKLRLGRLIQASCQIEMSL